MNRNKEVKFYIAVIIVLVVISGLLSLFSPVKTTTSSITSKQEKKLVTEIENNPDLQRMYQKFKEDEILDFDEFAIIKGYIEKANEL